MKFEGNKIILRDAILDDLEAVEYWMHPHHEWHKFDGPQFPPIKVEDIPEMMKKSREILEKGEFPDPRKSLAIAHKKSNARIGHVNRYWLSKETRSLAIGISIYDPAYWSKGIGTEALGFWTDYLFKSDLGLWRIDTRTWSGNERMMALANKLGFKEEARFRKSCLINGEYYDGMGYGLLKEEWESR